MNADGHESLYTEQIDQALALLAAIEPRSGLEQRVLAHLATAPQLTWYQRWVALPFAQHRWITAGAAMVVVAGSVGVTAYYHRPASPSAPLSIRIPRPAQQPAAAASSIGISQHPQVSRSPHHRGVHRGYRAMRDDHAPLPRGTAIPTRPQAIPLQ